MSATVSPKWLGLREPADAAARSTELADRLAQHLQGNDLVIHDLGAGTGSMARWLAPRLPGRQHWILHDREEALLERALADPPRGVTVEARLSDITELAPADLAGTSAVVASALLDMLTADQLGAVLSACHGVVPMLLAMTVVGQVELTPADPRDAGLAAAFNAHQRRDGRLGPDAVAHLGGGLVHPSPWRLGAAHAELTAEWLSGWLDATFEQAPALADDAYRELRLAQAATGELTVTVHHADVLVLP